MRQSTEKQQYDVRYCEEQLNIDFEGNLQNYDECQSFINIYLKDAKQVEMELSCEFEAYIWE